MAICFRHVCSSLHFCDEWRVFFTHCFVKKNMRLQKSNKSWSHTISNGSNAVQNARGQREVRCERREWKIIEFDVVFNDAVRIIFFFSRFSYTFFSTTSGYSRYSPSESSRQCERGDSTANTMARMSKKIDTQRTGETRNGKHNENNVQYNP